MEFSYMRIVVWRLGTWADTLRRRAWGRSIYNAEMRRWKAYEDQQATECIWTYQRRMTGWEGFHAVNMPLLRYFFDVERFSKGGSYRFSGTVVCQWLNCQPCPKSSFVQDV